MVQPELLGEGSFGCVFRPEIKCASKKKYMSNGKQREKRGNIVGKVFSDPKDFRDELVLSEQLAKIDPKGKTLMVPTSSCITTRQYALRHPASGECEQLFYTPRESTSQLLYQISMPYGGVDLYKYMVQHAVENRKIVSVKDFCNMISPVFDGIIMMDTKKWCHQDIKTPNIMVTPQKKAMLIDFGLMVPYQDVYSPRNRSRLRFSYFPYPPEYKLAYYQWNTCTDTCSIENEVLKNIHQFGTDRARTFFSYVSEQEVKQNIREFVGKLQKHRHDLQAYLTKYANRIDVYSVGTSILDIAKYIQINTLTKVQRQAWNNLIRAMIHPNPIHRATAKKAKQYLLELQKIL